MFVTYYIKFFHTVANRHKGILIFPLLLVAETISGFCKRYILKRFIKILFIRIAFV